MTGKPLWPLAVCIGLEVALAIVAAILHIWLLSVGTFITAVFFGGMFVVIRRQRSRR